MECRNNLDADSEFVGLQKRWLARALLPTQFDVVEMRSESRQTEIETANLTLAARRLVRLLHDLAHCVRLKIATLKIKVSPHCCGQQHDYKARQRPTDRLFPLHEFSLECLPDRDVVLCRINSRHRIQIAAEVNANRTNWRGIAQS